MLGWLSTESCDSSDGCAWEVEAAADAAEEAVAVAEGARGILTRVSGTSVGIDPETS